MSTHDENFDRALELAKRIKNLNDSATLKSELMEKWNLGERQFFRIKEDADKLCAWVSDEMEAMKQAAKDEMWAKITEKNMDGISKTVETLINMTTGNHYNDITKYTKEGAVTYKAKITDKGQQNAMKLLAKMTELFESLLKNNYQRFIKLSKALHEGKNEDTNDSNTIALIK